MFEHEQISILQQSTPLCHKPLFYGDLVSYVFLERFTIREFGNKCCHLQLYPYLPREPAKFGEHIFLADISVGMHFREKSQESKKMQN